MIKTGDIQRGFCPCCLNECYAIKVPGGGRRFGLTWTGDRAPAIFGEIIWDSARACWWHMEIDEGHEMTDDEVYSHFLDDLAFMTPRKVKQPVQSEQPVQVEQPALIAAALAEIDEMDFDADPVSAWSEIDAQYQGEQPVQVESRKPYSAPRLKPIAPRYPVNFTRMDKTDKLVWLANQVTDRVMGVDYAGRMWIVVPCDGGHSVAGVSAFRFRYFDTARHFFEMWLLSGKRPGYARSTIFERHSKRALQAVTL